MVCSGLEGLGTTTAFVLVMAVGSAGVGAGVTDVHWGAPVSGFWGVDANWSPVGAPGVGGVFDVHAMLDAGGLYTVTCDSSFVSLLEVSVVDPGATLEIMSGSYFEVFFLHNDGEIVVNPGNGAANASVAVQDTLDGSGTLRLAGTGGSATLGDGQFKVFAPQPEITQGSGHTIAGYGRVLSGLVNHGTLRADSTMGVLEWLGYNIDNYGVVEAVGGGELRFGDALQSDVTYIGWTAGSVVRADGGTMRVPVDCALFYETDNSGAFAPLEIINGGSFVCESGSQVFFFDVEVTGPIDVNGGARLQIGGDTPGGDVVNNGTILVNADGGAGEARVFHRIDTMLGGTGELVLGASGGEGAIRRTAAATLTHGADHTIRGDGLITTTMVNLGEIRSDFPGGEIRIADDVMTNSGLIETDGGSVVLEDQLIRGAGVVRALDGDVIVQSGASATIEDAAMESAPGSRFHVPSGAFLRMEDVTNDALVECDGGSTVQIEGLGTGVVTNNGLVRLNADGAGNTDGFLDSMMLLGTGRIEMIGGVNDASIECSDVVNGASHTIGGSGLIRGGVSLLVNEGLIVSDVIGGELVIEGGITNNREIRAQGGTLRLPTYVEMMGGGSVVLDGSDLVYGPFQGGSLSLGTLTTQTGVGMRGDGGRAVIESGGTMLVYGTHIDAPVDVRGGGKLQFDEFFTTPIDGTVTLNSDGAVGEALLDLGFFGDATITGSGEIALNGDPLGGGAEARIDIPSGFTGTIGGSVTLSGHGLLDGDVVVEGVTSPGSVGAYGQLRFGGGAVLGADHTFEFNGFGDGFSNVSFSESLALDGTLVVDGSGLGAGFDFGSSATLIFAPGFTGSFDEIVIIDPAPPVRLGVNVGTFEVSVRVLCPVDLNGDGEADFFDVSLLIQDQYDYNNDGQFDFFDISAFLQRFADGCGLARE